MKLRFFLKKWHDHIFVNVVPNQKYGCIYSWELACDRPASHPEGNDPSRLATETDKKKAQQTLCKRTACVNIRLMMKDCTYVAPFRKKYTLHIVSLVVPSPIEVAISGGIFYKKNEKWFVNFRHFGPTALRHKSFTGIEPPVHSISLARRWHIK
jgi:hypothetical protein